MRKLVGLEVLGGIIVQLWNGPQIMKNLKFMKLEQLNCLTKFPDISRAPNMERLSLSYCKNLVEVPDFLGSHKRLVYLNMDGCERLKHLPTRIKMESLKFLSLRDCYSLKIFPDISGAPNMYELILVGCKNLVDVHESLGSHKRLVSLYMTGCEQLKDLPFKIEMESLKFLSFAFCHSLEIFPDVSGAPNIETLLLLECKNLVEIHESFGYQKRLLVLTMSGCKQLKHLRFKIEMESLKFLSLAYCDCLEIFPDVSGAPNIKTLNMSYCKSLVKVHESLGSLKRLVKLEMRGCEQLKHLPSWIEMECLNNLNI